MPLPDRRSTARAVGVVAGAAGVAASLFVLFGPVVTYETVDATGGRTTGTISGIDYLFGAPNAQVELFAWPVLLGAVAALGAAAAWRERTRWVGAAALTMAAFTLVGIMTIGSMYAPASVLMLVATVLGRR